MRIKKFFELSLVGGGGGGGDSKSLDQTQCKSYFHSCILAVDLSNKNNKKILRCVWSKGLLKPNIMVRKGAIVTYIWSFHENFENYRKLVLR